MERFIQLKDQAKRNLDIAEHILTVTYPLLKDTKLLLGVSENIFLGLTNSMSSVLHYELIFKRIPPFYEDFDSKLNVFGRKVIPRHNIKRDNLILLQEVKDLVLKHKKAPVEFVRKDNLVMCDDEYKDVETLSAPKLRDLLERAKKFQSEMAKITEEHENLFKRRAPE